MDTFLLLLFFLIYVIMHSRIFRFLLGAFDLRRARSDLFLVWNDLNAFGKIRFLQFEN